MSSVRVLVQWALLAGLFLTSCGQNKRLVVYADPWLKDYAERITAEFQQQHPDVEVKLKVLSSEVIFQHLHYGQPVDVFLCFGDQLLPGAELQSMVEDMELLADTRIVKVTYRNPEHQLKQRQFGSEGCRVVEASDRPLRRFTELSFGEFPSGRGCTLIANFQSQLVDYLRRGWVETGFVPQHFARRDSAKLESAVEGPLIAEAFSALLLKDAPNPASAQAFFALVRSEKTAQLLGELGFVP